MAASSSSSKKGKQFIVSISSSSSEQEQESEEEDVDESQEEDDDDDEEEEEEEESEESEEDEESEESEEDEEDESDEEYEEEDESFSDDGDRSTDDDGDADCSKGKLTDEELCNRVIDLLRRRQSLNILKLEECKPYMRKHELRLSGTKATCIERILEHWRLKDVDGEKLYPRSSFVINCTGDVCTGDVILFKQRVYEKFDIVTRGGNIIGKRTIAGRVVKESYGAAKQQHTFTVEILWSKGVKALPPLFPLLVKGRNLYRLKTFRQRWNNEAERSKVLAEKHRRGAAARHVRKIAKFRFANKGFKQQKNTSNSRQNPKKRRKKELAHATKKQKIHTDKVPLKGQARRQVAKPKKQKIHTDKAPSKGQARRQVAKPGYLEPTARHPNHASYNENGMHTRPPFPQRVPYNNHHYSTPVEFHHRSNIPASQASRGPFHFPNYDLGYSSITNGALHHQSLSRSNYVNHPYSSFTSQSDPRSSSYPWRQVDFLNGPTLPPGMQFHGWRNRP